MNEKDLMGMPALGCATKNGHLKTAEALLAVGAEVDEKDNQYGASALIIAAFNAAFHASPFGRPCSF